MIPRIVFMGSPDFAVPTLEALAQEYPIAGVVTQPDQPAGRGRVLLPPPVKTLAQQLGLEIMQPRRLRDPQAMAQLEAWAPDLIIVAAFGQILRPAVLDLPRYGCINVHASLLPRWRGAAPIQAAILHGDDHSGVTIMRMDAGVDTGPILSQRPETIYPGDTSLDLSQRLAAAGASLLMETLPAYLEGQLQPQPQDDAQATYAPMLQKEDGLLDFTRPAIQLERQVRAFHPWPGAYFPWQDQPLKVLRASVADTAGTHRLPGERLIWGGKPAIVTSDGILILEELQPAGKKAMTGKAFLAGARHWA